MILRVLLTVFQYMVFDTSYEVRFTVDISQACLL